MRYFFALLLTILLASPALAHQCPTLITQIDRQLETLSIDPELREDVLALRDEGDVYHRQGKHAEAVQALNEALELLKEAARTPS